MKSVQPVAENKGSPLESQLLGWLPVVLWTLLIFTLSSRPYTAYFSELEGSSHRIFQRFLQYPAHLTEYMALAFLWMRAALRQCVIKERVTWITLSAVLSTALIDETIQHFVPTRTFAFRDLFMDAAGGVVAVIISHRIFPELKRTQTYALPQTAAVSHR